MQVMQSKINPRSADFQANAAHDAGAGRRPAREGCPGRAGRRRGRARQAHLARGKLLPRERVDHCSTRARPSWRSASWPPAACTTTRRPAAGMIAGIGRVEGVECMIVANDATVKGGTYYPMTVKKHLRAQEIAAAEPPAVHLPGRLGRRLPAQAGRGLPRPRPLRPHLLQPGQHVGAGHPADRGGDGLVHRRRRLRAGDERRDHHRARTRAPSSWAARRW